MSLNYDKLKEKERGNMNDGGSFWTSYSDLAIVLSILFLTLYAMASLRSTSMSVTSQIALRDSQQQVEELQKQIQAYQVLKEDYLQKGASDVEKKMYEDLLKKMKLLADEAKEQKEEALAKARENEEREDGLNKYQYMIKNIITANMLAQKDLKKRDQIIEQKSESITELKGIVSQKEQTLAENNLEIEKIHDKLESSINKLKAAYKSRAQSKKKLEGEIAKLKDQSAEEVAALEKQNTQVAQQLEGAKSLISSKTQELQKKQVQIKTLETEKSQILGDLEKKERDFQAEMAQIQNDRDTDLEKQRQQFGAELAKQKLTDSARLEKEQAFREQLEKEKGDYDIRMKSLEGKLEGTQREIADTKGLLAQRNKELGQKQSQIQTLEGEKSKILGDLEREKQGFQRSLGQLAGDYQGSLAKQKGEFEASLAKEKLGADERGAREAAFRKRMEGEKAEYDAKVRDLTGKLDGTKQAIAQKEAAYQGSLRQLASTNSGLEKELGAIRQRELEKQNLANKIKRNFTQAGIDADINSRTGEVTIHFGREYFDTGSSKLTGGMSSTLQQAIPIYAKSIFEDPKLAEKISSVEIVGFASPTYRGQYVNPKDLSPKARRAVNYNMDLSYQRAKSIFEYVFDPRKLDYVHQKDLLSISKVSGQSYLRATASDNSQGPLTDDEYCQKYDCTKSQKVIIKFNFLER